jgi:hypothetical protein
MSFVSLSEPNEERRLGNRSGEQFSELFGIRFPLPHLERNMKLLSDILFLQKDFINVYIVNYVYVFFIYKI